MVLEPPPERSRKPVAGSVGIVHVYPFVIVVGADVVGDSAA